VQTPDTVSTSTLGVYRDLGAWSRADDGTWLLLTLIDSVGSQLDQTEQYTRDDAAHVGWGKLLDVAACPSIALPWLAQFAGVVVPVGVTDDQIRNLIQTQPNAKRGTPATITAVAQSFLSGTQRVDLLERTPTPYSFRVRVYEGEAGDSANQDNMKMALLAAKPAGLIMTVTVQAGPTIDELVGTIDTQDPPPGGTVDDYATEVPV
jgi:hypothetical protein